MTTETLFELEEATEPRPALQAAAVEPEASAITAADLTTEHYGLQVSYWRPATSLFPEVRHTIVIDEIRRFVSRGTPRVEVIDMSNPRGQIVGDAYFLDGSTPVVLGRRIRKARRRPWGKGAMKPGETWADVGGFTPIPEIRSEGEDQ